MERLSRIILHNLPCLKEKLSEGKAEARLRPEEFLK
jgi:hypothetical protein